MRTASSARILVARVLVSLALALAAAPPARSAPSRRPPLVQSVHVEVPVAPTPVTIAGKKHLAYEIHLTNFRTTEVALTRIAVLDAVGTRSLADFRDAELAARLGHPGVSEDPADKRLISGGRRAVVYLWLPLDPAVAAPTKLRHTIEFDRIGPEGRDRGVVEGAIVDVRPEQPIVLDPPLHGGPWVAVYDPQLVGGHRTSIYTIDGRARVPARYAIDWLKLDGNAKLARGDKAEIANWHGYGAEVFAVADAVVAAASDDLSDSPLKKTSTAPMPLADHSGNYVTLDLRGGRYAFYEHLKPGSIKVKTGDRVTSGQVIGQLGNSGSSSSGPHLHFHVADANAVLGAEGLPYVFRSFEVLGAYETIDGHQSGDPWRAAPEATGGARKMELPAPNVVLTFSEGATSNARQD